MNNLNTFLVLDFRIELYKMLKEKSVPTFYTILLYNKKSNNRGNNYGNN